MDEVRQRPRHRRGLFGGVKFGGMISEGSPIAGRCVQRESAYDPCAWPPGGAPIGNHPTSTHVPRPRKGRAAAPIDTARRAGITELTPKKQRPTCDTSTMDSKRTTRLFIHFSLVSGSQRAGPLSNCCCRLQ